MAQETSRQLPDEAQVLGWMESLSNWGRWGDDDQLGTLNLITDAKRAQAAGLVKEGISVTCSRLIVPEMAADVTSIPPLHYMVRAGDSVPAEGSGGTSDFIGFSFHGLTIPPLDALCHQVWNGKMYNGYARDTIDDAGCSQLGIQEFQQGIFPRGILMDIARLKGVDYLEPATPIYAEDLEAWLDHKPITARPVTWMERSWRWCKRKPAVAALVLLLLALLLNVPFSQRVAPAAGALIKHISLLIFPLGVGIVLQWHRYEDYALALGVAVVLGTLLSLVLVTLMLKKLLGGKHGESAGGRHDG